MTAHPDSNSASGTKLTVEQNVLVSDLLCDAVRMGRPLADLPTVRDAVVKQLKALNAETVRGGEPDRPPHLTSD